MAKISSLNSRRSILKNSNLNCLGKGERGRSYSQGLVATYTGNYCKNVNNGNGNKGSSFCEKWTTFPYEKRAKESTPLLLTGFGKLRMWCAPYTSRKSLQLLLTSWNDRKKKRLVWFECDGQKVCPIAFLFFSSPFQTLFCGFFPTCIWETNESFHLALKAINNSPNPVLQNNC